MIRLNIDLKYLQAILKKTLKVIDNWSNLNCIDYWSYSGRQQGQVGFGDELLVSSAVSG